MQKWEYKIELSQVKGMMNPAPETDTEKKMAALGAEGWELISFAPLQGSARGTSSFILVYKRAV